MRHKFQTGEKVVFTSNGPDYRIGDKGVFLGNTLHNDLTAFVNIRMEDGRFVDAFESHVERAEPIEYLTAPRHFSKQYETLAHIHKQEPLSEDEKLRREVAFHVYRKMVDDKATSRHSELLAKLAVMFANDFMKELKKPIE